MGVSEVSEPRFGCHACNKQPEAGIVRTKTSIQ
jgi:hypothetical protein